VSMLVIRDEERIARMKKISQITSTAGFVILAAGFILLFIDNPNRILFQTLALILGWLVAQIGMYLSHRYGRSPRPDEVLDDAIRPVATDGRLYHYILPAPHVLLTQAGPIIFVLKYQTGRISVEGDRWKQRGIGYRRIFGQEGLGNPSKDAETMVKTLANFIRKNAPDVEEVAIGALIVFTSKNIESLDVKGSDIPAMHFSKVKGFLRQKGVGNKLAPDVYNSLRTAFDEAAGDLVDN